MMKRKVNLVGKNTLTVSLPSKWIKQQKIKKGDELEIIQEKDLLILNAKEKKTTKAIVIDFNKFKDYHNFYLGYPYTEGFDIVKIKFKTPQDIKIIKRDIGRCLGFEIIHQGMNSCTIKCVSDMKKEEFDNLLRRIFLSIQQMLDDTLVAINNKGYSAFKNISEQDVIIDKLGNSCLRILTKFNYQDNYLMEMAILIVKLENMGDSIKNALAKKINKLTHKEIDYFKKVRSLFLLFYEQFYKQESKKIDKIVEDSTNIEEEILETITQSKNPKFLFYLLRLTVQIKSIKSLLHRIRLLKEYKNLDRTIY